MGENIQTYTFSELSVLYISRSFCVCVCVCVCVGINPIGIEELDLLGE